MKNDFIAIDFETAMYSPASAISIGLVKYHDYQPVDSYYSLIRPPKLYIRPEFTDIHGLTVDDVIDAPTFAEIWDKEILDFLGGESLATPLVAHNATFDMKVLKATLRHYQKSVPSIPYFCSCKLARRVWPSLQSHALTALAKEFDIIYEAHNALADADTCGKVVQMAAEKFGGKSSLEKLLGAAGITIKYL